MDTQNKSKTLEETQQNKEKIEIRFDLYNKNSGKWKYGGVCKISGSNKVYDKELLKEIEDNQTEVMTGTITDGNYIVVIHETDRQVGNPNYHGFYHHLFWADCKDSEKMLKVVISPYHYFELSKLALQWLKDRGLKNYFSHDRDLRIHPLLVKCVETLGNEAGEHLKIVEIPDNIDWYIDEDEDGSECIRETHRIWY
jgi:hypothetical protein